MLRIADKISRRLRFFILCLCASSFTVSCQVAATKYFINNKREMTVCTSAYQAFGLGVATAALQNVANIEACEKELKKMGFTHVSEVGDVGLNLSTSGTVVVVQVADMSSAKEQGIQVGDQILSVNNELVQTDNDAYRLIFGEIATKVEVSTIRQADTLKYTLYRRSFEKIWKIK